MEMIHGDHFVDYGGFTDSFFSQDKDKSFPFINAIQQGGQGLLVAFRGEKNFGSVDRLNGLAEKP